MKALHKGLCSGRVGYPTDPCSRWREGVGEGMGEWAVAEAVSQRGHSWSALVSTTLTPIRKRPRNKIFYQADVVADIIRFLPVCFPGRPSVRSSVCLNVRLLPGCLHAYDYAYSATKWEKMNREWMDE